MSSAVTASMRAMTSSSDWISPSPSSARPRPPLPLEVGCRQAFALQAVELGLDDLDRLLDAFGRGPRVDREVTGVVERGAVRVHGIREPSLFADLLEQPRRHAAAQGVIHHGERVTV